MDKSSGHFSYFFLRNILGPSHGSPASLFSPTLLLGFLVGVPQVLSLALLLFILHLSLGRLPQLCSEARFFPLATLQASPKLPPSSSH